MTLFTRSLALCFIALLTFAAGAPAADAPAGATAPKPISVAIVDFEVGSGAKPESGRQIAEALTALLSDAKGVRLVDRASIDKTLQELALNKTGLVDDDNAIKVGKLVGAKILITGKVFILGKTSYVTGKIIGTETSLVEGVVTTGKEDDDVGLMVVGLADKIKAKLADSAAKLIAPDAAPDDGLVALKTKLAALKKPKVSVHIDETHVTGTPGRGNDPAAETEIKSMLTQCGFTVIESNQVAGAGVEVAIEGQAFSEMATRIGNLVSCNSRVEIKLVNKADGKDLFVDKATSRAADVSEQTAGKAAIQQASHDLGIKILQQFATSLPPEK